MPTFVPARFDRLLAHSVKTLSIGATLRVIMAPRRSASFLRNCGCIMQRGAVPTFVPASVRVPFRFFRFFRGSEVMMFCRKHRYLLLAGELGFEPRLTESESAVLPLNYSPPDAPAIASQFWRFYNPGRRVLQ